MQNLSTLVFQPAATTVECTAATERWFPITFPFGSLNMRGSAATRLHRAVLHKLLRRVVIASIVVVCGSFGKG